MKVVGVCCSSLVGVGMHSCLRYLRTDVVFWGPLLSILCLLGGVERLALVVSRRLENSGCAKGIGRVHDWFNGLLERMRIRVFFNSVGGWLD